MKYGVLLVILLANSILVCGCERSNMGKKATDIRATENIAKINWDGLAKKKIYFGHQSVGFNIINGIIDIADEYPNLKLNVKETRNVEDFNEPIFAHSTIGGNNGCISKINEFKRVLDSGVGEKVDIAFLKFCFVDIKEGTDIELIFKNYVEAISYLELKYPKVKFVHFTVPLTIIQSGVKAKIKKIMGKDLWGEKDNIQRSSFNKKLIEKYGAQKTIFDLAMHESTYPQGQKSTFKKDGQEFPLLIKTFTDDGDHLNKTGRKVIATKLLLFLKNI